MFFFLWTVRFYFLQHLTKKVKPRVKHCHIPYIYSESNRLRFLIKSLNDLNTQIFRDLTADTYP